MKNKSLHLLVLMSALLLAGCGEKQPESTYHYESEDWEISFDYAFKNALGDEISKIFILDDEEMTESNFNRFLAVLNYNDFYANKVTYIIDSQVLYLEEDDVTKVAGDYIKSTRYDLKRNNQTNSITGTVTIHDESWDKEEGSTVLNHKNIDTTGSYSLSHDELSGVGKEIITCDNEEYSSTKNIGYSQQIWGNKMNLTQSEYIGSKFTEDFELMNKANESVAEPYKAKGSLRCKKSDQSVKVTFSTTRQLKTTHNSVVEVSYYDSVKIAGGMITETEHKRVEIDKSESKDFVIKLDREFREISYE